MSFGWSAGDIAAAISLAYSLIQALDSCDGAANEYREAVNFLRHLNNTLKPLAQFPELTAHPGYGKEIAEQVGYIKEPVETFLKSAEKYTASLGASAAKGHHRHIFPKLKWHIFVSKKVVALRRKIESNMRIIDSLMQRLTLDVVLATEQKLPNTLRATLQETLRPALISILRDNVAPLHTESVVGLPELQSSRTIEGMGLSSDIIEMKVQMEKSSITQSRIEASLKDEVSPRKQQGLLEGPRLQDILDGDPHDPDVEEIKPQESLRELYSLVLLFLGHFLKNLFIVLSRMVQPSKALMPVLLAKYNLSFLDALGSPARVLPIEFFRSFKVLQTFIQHEFEVNNLPGASWVKNGRYQIFGLSNTRALAESSWSSSISPGTTVAMSMVVRRTEARHDEKGLGSEKNYVCPQRDCTGTWPRRDVASWVTCPICQKQVLTSTLQHVGADMKHKIPKALSASSLPQAGEPTTLRELYSKDIDEEEISHFKRVVQEVLNTMKARNRRLQPADPSRAAGPSSSVRPFSGRFDEAMPVRGGLKHVPHVESRSPPSRTYSGIFNSAMPLPDPPDDSQQSFRASSRDRNITGGYNILYKAASLFDFNINAVKLEAGFPYLTYQAGEIFDVVAIRGELWLAKNQDDPSDEMGWIWYKHFHRLAED